MSFQIQGIEPLCLKPTPNMYDMNEMICMIWIYDVIFYNASHCKILQAESRRWDIAKLAANMLIALLDSRIFCNTIWRWQYVSVQTEGNDWKIPRQSNQRINGVMSSNRFSSHVVNLKIKLGQQSSFTKTRPDLTFQKDKEHSKKQIPKPVGHTSFEMPPVASASECWTRHLRGPWVSGESSTSISTELIIIDPFLSISCMTPRTWPDHCPVLKTAFQNRRKLIREHSFSWDNAS